MGFSIKKLAIFLFGLTEVRSQIFAKGIGVTYSTVSADGRIRAFLPSVYHCFYDWYIKFLKFFYKLDPF